MGQPEAATRVLLIRVEGAITPVVADFIADSVAEAESGDYAALVVGLDTPGGLDISTREIAQSLLGATVPVVVYVSPEGARAASAGALISLAAHVVAMAPATSIGAATPVDPQGGEITDKILNDAAAFAVSLAEARNRDVEFAEEAVREGRSVTAREAEEIGVADFIATDLDDLLIQLDGHRVEPIGVVLKTDGAVVERSEMSGIRSLLGRIADPNIAFVLLSLGTLAIVYEAANPGLGFSGIAGVIMLIVAFFSLSVLPVRTAGIALFVLGVGLLVAELFVPGIGVLAAGGAIAFLLSGLFLFEGTVRVSPTVLLPSAVVLGAASALAGREVLKARRQPATTGPSKLIGRRVKVEGTAERPLAFLEGTWWTLEGSGPGKVAQVVAVNGVQLQVEEVSDDV
jgi:membrane-bound serine protease (ClpP class)